MAKSARDIIQERLDRANRGYQQCIDPYNNGVKALRRNEHAQFGAIIVELTKILKELDRQETTAYDLFDPSPAFPCDHCGSTDLHDGNCVYVTMADRVTA